jgi:hypothetical protein
VVWTKETLFICRGPALVDKIPLHEVLGVTEMKDEIEGHRPAPNRGSLFSSVSVSGESRNKIDSRIEEPENCFVQKQKTFSIQGNLSNILQIKTIADGFNSGRTYYFSTRDGTNPEFRRQNIVSKLSEIVVKAQRKAQAKSRFQKSQEMVQRLQKSMLFQTAVAVLIMLVNHKTARFHPAYDFTHIRFLHSTRPAQISSAPSR